VTPRRYTSLRRRLLQERAKDLRWVREELVRAERRERLLGRGR
jgi:hypothetical protein